MVTELVQFAAGFTVLALIAVAFYRAGKEVAYRETRRTLYAARLRAKRLEAELDQRLTHPSTNGRSRGN